LSQSETIIGLGARTDYLAQVPNADPARLSLTPEERRLFTAVGRVSRIGDLLQGAGLEEPRAIALLLSLRAKGAVVPARVQKPVPTDPVDAALCEEVDLPAERKKEILDLERALDRLNHFEVLGLRPGASAEEARKAYYDASRRYHPDRYFGKNLGSFRARVERIFRRLTEAYDTLNDSEKRAAFFKAHPALAAPAPALEPTAAPAAPPSSPGAQAPDPSRIAERRARMARHPYLARQARLHELLERARGHIARGEPALAYTDLNTAAQLDPQNKEIAQLLAEARRRHEAARGQAELTRALALQGQGDFQGALEHARAALELDRSHLGAHLLAVRLILALGEDTKELRALAQRAVELAPKDPEAHLLLGSILLDAGLKKLAKKHLEEALALGPQNAEAKRLLKKLRWPF
jgi:curved DNA-binding protein CbpA